MNLPSATASPNRSSHERSRVVTTDATDPVAIAPAVDGACMLDLVGDDAPVRHHVSVAY